MLVRLADSVPESERRWIAALVRRCGRRWGFANWEVIVRCVSLPGDTAATASVYPTGSQVEVKIDPKRLQDRRCVRSDLIHELWHVPMWGMFMALQDLSIHIPKSRRAKALDAALQRYETAHDYTARLWDPFLKER